MADGGKIRILLDIHPRIWGGIETFTVRLVKHLDRRCFASHVYTSANGTAAAELAKECIAVTTRPSGAIDELAFIRSLLTKLDVDVVQAHHVNSSLALAAKSIGKPVLWRIGGHIDEIMKGSRADAKRRSLCMIGMAADHIVCPSRFVAAQFVGLPAAPVSTIHNGVDADRIGARVQAKRSAPSGRLIVGMVGHLVPQKRHVDLLAAARLVKDRYPKSQFRIFGGPYPTKRSTSYLARLQDVTRHLGLTGHVSIEYCTEDKFKRYSEADIMVFPGVNEGCSNAILETMALGLPIIAAASGGNAELIENGKSGLLCPAKKPRLLAEAILALASHPGRRDQLGAVGRERARRMFHISRCAARYGDIYQALARGRQPSSNSFFTASATRAKSLPRRIR